MFPRLLESQIKKVTETTRLGVMLLGPRQTGKSTLIEHVLSGHDCPQILRFPLNENRVYEELIKKPSSMLETVLASLEKGPVVVFIDEVQRVPAILDDCQTLLDRYRERVAVYLTGSSARKLRRAGVNLLPGRVILRYLHPLTLPEAVGRPLSESFIVPAEPVGVSSPQPPVSLDELLTYGALPGVLALPPEARREVLTSYVSTYLQEEIRAEALVRNIGHFARLLELTALRSGHILNISALSRDTGIPASTITSYLQILEDTLIVATIPAYARRSHKRLIKSPKHLFFDLGVRNACAGLYLDPAYALKTQAGELFEQWVALELLRRISYIPACPWKLYYWRTTSGVEVDLVLDKGDELVPIEVKYSTTPRLSDAKGLMAFMKEYGAKRGFLVGRFLTVQKLAEDILAIPWDRL